MRGTSYEKSEEVALKIEKRNKKKLKRLRKEDRQERRERRTRELKEKIQILEKDKNKNVQIYKYSTVAQFNGHLTSPHSGKRTTGSCKNDKPAGFGL